MQHAPQGSVCAATRALKTLATISPEPTTYRSPLHYVVRAARTTWSTPAGDYVVPRKSRCRYVPYAHQCQTEREAKTGRSSVMEHSMASRAQYLEHQRQMAWINAEGWQFEQPEQRYRLRLAVARVLIHLATLLTPHRQEARTA